jgi:uncharacterized protein (TIGR03435 family)
MNRKKTSEELLSQALGLFKEPPMEEMESAGDRVRTRLSSEARESHEPAAVLLPAPFRRRPLRLLAAAVAVGVIAVVAGSGILQNWNAPAKSPVAEIVLSRVSMDQIESRQVFHSDDRSGMTLVLPDDSHVEMRVQTELSLERAADGLRILLKKGSILVSAAKQRTGHLYVQTKDVSVSVVGTVFLVRAEEQGSRVAVIEGEVHVQEGTTTERLLPGEQVATSSRMAAHPVVEDISWSRHAERLFAMLQQSASPPATAAAEPSDKFEVTSIRPGPAPPAGPGARGGGGVSVALPCPTANPFEMDLLFQLDPGRVLMRRQTLYSLIALAYGHSCPAPDTMTGGSDWMRTDNFELEATIPAGTPRYTKEQMFSGNAPRLQRMLQNLLADEFKLVLKRDVKEVQGYNLVVAQEGKLKLSVDQTPDQALPPPTPGALLKGGGPAIPSVMAPISRLVSMLQRSMDRPIADRTGLTGLYDIWLEFPEVPMPTPPPEGTPPSEVAATVNQTRLRIRDLLPARLETTTGLRLEAARVPVQVLVIVSAEKPSPH